MKFKRQKALRVAGIFAGIGGFEVGLEKAGHKSVLLRENDLAAQAVLRKHFKRRLLVADVAEIDAVPRDVDLLAAGFPCQDLSQVGLTQGLNGKISGRVAPFFRWSIATTWAVLLLSRGAPEPRPKTEKKAKGGAQVAKGAPANAKASKKVPS